MAVIAVALLASVPAALVQRAYVGAAPLRTTIALCAVPVATSLLASKRGAAVRLPVAVLAQLWLATSLMAGAVLPGPGAVAELLDGVVHGWARTDSSTWPVFTGPGTAAWLPVLSGLVAVGAVELLFLRGALARTALIPPVAGLVVTQLLVPAADDAARLAALIVVVAVGVVLSVTGRQPRPVGSPTPAAAATPARRSRARQVQAGGRRVPALGAAAMGVFVVLGSGAAVAIAPAAVPRERVPVTVPDRLGNPLAELSLRSRDPDRVVFENTAGSSVRLWRLAVLDAFDGVRWSSEPVLKPFGARLGRDPFVTVSLRVRTAEVTVKALGSPWLPTVDRPVSLYGMRAYVDEQTGVVVAGDEPRERRYWISWHGVEPAEAAVEDFGVAPSDSRPAMPSLPPALDRYAALFRDSPVTTATALQLESFLRTHFSLTAKAPFPTGHGFPELERFLTTGAGTSEQFASAYAVIARSLRLQVRVAVGFRQPSAAENDRWVVRNRHAVAWPEVRLAGIGWYPLDPTGADRERGRAAESSVRPSMPPLPSSGPAQQSTPPTTPPVTTPPPVVEPPDQDPTVPWLLIAMLVPIGTAGAVASVPLRKSARRRRRRAATPASAVAGAWLELRDRLWDRGVEIPAALTPRRAAGHLAGTLTTGAIAALESLADCVDHASWSGRRTGGAQAGEAWALAAVVEEAYPTGRWSSLRCALSTRSLRRRH